MTECPSHGPDMPLKHISEYLDNMKISNRELWTAGLLYGDPTAMGARDPGPRVKRDNPEQRILQAIMQALQYHPNVAWRARVNSGAYKTPDGRFIRFGFPGCPDILGQMKDGRILMIEVKSDSGSLTQEQRAMLDTVKTHKGCAGMARSVADALRIVES